MQSEDSTSTNFNVLDTLRLNTAMGLKNTFLKNGRVQDEGYRWCLNTFNLQPTKKQVDPDRIKLCAMFGFYYETSKKKTMCFSCGADLPDKISPAFPQLHSFDCPLVFDNKGVNIPKPISLELSAPHGVGDSGYDTPLSTSLFNQPPTASEMVTSSVVQAENKKKSQKYVNSVGLVVQQPSSSVASTQCSKSPILLANLDQSQFPEQLKSFAQLYLSEKKQQEQEKETLSSSCERLSPTPDQENDFSDSDDHIEPAQPSEDNHFWLDFDNNHLGSDDEYAGDSFENDDKKHFRSPPITSSDDSDDEKFRSKYLLNEEENIRYASIMTKSQIREMTKMELWKERDRRSTFEQWSFKSDHVNADDLAKNGFFYWGAAEEHVQCFYCGVEVLSWRGLGDVISTHQSLSPDCKFAGKRYNSAMSTLDKSGIYHPESDNEPVVATPSYLRQERGKKNHECQNPIHPNMKKLYARIQSFPKRWPMSMPQKFIEKIAQAGFFYFGEKDRVKCFYCNGHVENWKLNDDPFARHAMQFPTCEYILQCKGEAYVSTLKQSPSGQIIDAAKTLTLKSPSKAKFSPQAESSTSSLRGNIAPTFFRTPEMENCSSFSTSEIEKNSSSHVCKNCHANAVSVVVLPCRHLSVCDLCSQSIQRCPKCQEGIAFTFKIYLN